MRLRNDKENTMKKWKLLPAMLFLLALFVYGMFDGSMRGQGAALAAERKAKDITVVLYMTDW